MNRIDLLIFRLIVLGVGMIGICASAQIPRVTPESLPCITDATIQVTASRSQLILGESSVVSWSVDMSDECDSVRVRLNSEEVPRIGSRTVFPSRSSTYILTIRQTQLGVSQQRTQSTRIGVNYPDRVVIDASTRDPVQVLIGALGSNPVTIELCNVELNLTGLSLEIGDDTSLIASPGCARGLHSLGPLIFVTDNRAISKPLFLIRGDNILFSGFRLQGPTNGIGRGNNRLEKGILIFPFGNSRPINNIEINNMEMFYWSGAAVEIRDNTAQAERGRLFNTNERAVRIRNNFIHDNRHGSGYGYGVNVANGAYALIEQNVFNQNRHAVSGDSSDGKKDFSGYTARDNLILSDGGLHCSDSKWWALLGWTNLRCWQTHQIDMHGNKSIWGYDYCCGTAGETMIIERNTILYDAGNAIKIRGNPGDKAVVDGNVFRGSRSNAIAQNGSGDSILPRPGANITKPIDVRPNNVFGAKPMSQLGSCDFDLDGKLDKFMATGVTWWAQSGETGQWYYLNTMPEKLPQLQLGNVDSDGICDVAIRLAGPTRPFTYSKNGRGPWVPVPVLQLRQMHPTQPLYSVVSSVSPIP